MARAVRKRASKPRPTCRACGKVLAGRYCHACGEDSQPGARRMKDIVDDLLDNVLSFSAAVPRTLVALFTRPALVPCALRDGDRKTYLSPTKLYVTATLVFFLFLGMTGVTIVQWRIVATGPGPMRAPVTDGVLGTLDNFVLKDLWLHRASHEPRGAEAIAALDDAIPRIIDPAGAAVTRGVRAVALQQSGLNQAIATWMPRILWLLMPLYALLLWALYAKGRLISEHVIFALWAHTMIFLLLILGALWNMGVEPVMAALGSPLVSAGGLTIAVVIYQIYLTIALKGYYRHSWRGAVFKGALLSAVYIGLIWYPLTVAMLMFLPAFEHLPAGA